MLIEFDLERRHRSPPLNDDGDFFCPDFFCPLVICKLIKREQKQLAFTLCLFFKQDNMLPG